MARPTPLKCFEKSICSPVPASVANIECAGEEWFGSMRGVVCFFKFSIASDDFSRLVQMKGYEKIRSSEARINRAPEWFRPPASAEFFARQHDGRRKNAMEYLCLDETGTNAWFTLWAPD